MENNRYLPWLLSLSRIKQELLASIIGLVRASVENNVSTDHTGSILCDALLAVKCGEDAGCEIQLKNVRSEKALLAPDCAVCANLCGRTADYSMEEFRSEGIRLQEMKAGMLYMILEELETADDFKDFEGLYHRLFMFGYEKDDEQFALFLFQLSNART